MNLRAVSLLACCFVPETTNAQDTAVVLPPPFTRDAGRLASLRLHEIAAIEIPTTGGMTRQLEFTADAGFLVLAADERLYVHELATGTVHQRAFDGVLTDSLGDARIGLVEDGVARVYCAATRRIVAEHALVRPDSRPFPMLLAPQVSAARFDPQGTGLFLSYLDLNTPIPTGSTYRFDFGDNRLREVVPGQCLQHIVRLVDGRIFVQGRKPVRCARAPDEGVIVTVDRDGRASKNLANQYAPVTSDVSWDQRHFTWSDGRYVHRCRLDDGRVVQERFAAVYWWHMLDPVLALTHDGERFSVWHEPTMTSGPDLAGPWPSIDYATLSRRGRMLGAITKGMLRVWRIDRD